MITAAKPHIKLIRNCENELNWIIANYYDIFAVCDNLIIMSAVHFCRHRNYKLHGQKYA